MLLFKAYKKQGLIFYLQHLQTSKNHLRSSLRNTAPTFRKIFEMVYEDKQKLFALLANLFEFLILDFYGFNNFKQN